MKRAKKFAALAVIASLVLGSTGLVFAEDLDEDAALVEDVAEEEDADEDEDAAAEAIADEIDEDLADDEEDAVEEEEEAEAIVYPLLNPDIIGAEAFYCERLMYRGTFPVFDFADLNDFNTEIKEAVWETYYFTAATDAASMSDANAFSVRYLIVDQDISPYAVVVLTYDFNLATIALGEYQEWDLFFINKLAMIDVDDSVEFVADFVKAFEEAAEEDGLLSKAASAEDEDKVFIDIYTALAAIYEDEAEEEEEILEEEDAEDEEPVMVPLRATAEGLGWTVGWDGETNSVSVSLGDNVLALVVVGEASFNVPGVEDPIPLSAASYNDDGTVYVSADFFEILLENLEAMGDLLEAEEDADEEIEEEEEEA